MKFTSLWKLLLVVLLTFGLAACGGNDDTDSASEDTNSTQSQTIDSVDFLGGTLSVIYPAGWAAQGSQWAILLANSAEALELANTPYSLADGQAAGTVTFLGSGAGLLGLEPSATTVDALANFSARLLSGEAGIQAELGTPEAFTANGKGGAIATGSSEDNAITFSLAVAIIEESDGYALIVFSAPEGEIDQYKDTIKAIAGSVEYIGGAIEITPEATSGEVEGTPEPTPAG
jgi:hypothetical protein